jgi:replication-associated recombination protein RarA
MAIKRATADVQEKGNIRPPKALADGSWYGRQLGKGEGYIYPHSDPAGSTSTTSGRAEGHDVLRTVG